MGKTRLRWQIHLIYVEERPRLQEVEGSSTRPSPPSLSISPAAADTPRDAPAGMSDACDAEHHLESDLGDCITRKRCEPRRLHDPDRVIKNQSRTRISKLEISRATHSHGKLSMMS